VLRLSPEPARAVAEERALRAWSASGRGLAVRACDPGAGALVLAPIGDGTPLARRDRAVGVEAVASPARGTPALLHGPERD